MISIFRSKKKDIPEASVEPIKVDMHSHLLPGIDDGAQNMPQSLDMVRRFISLGYEKLIMTPHVMSDYYKNTPEIILDKLEKLKEKVKIQELKIELEAAAEYYLDEFLIQKLDNKERLLTFGDNYLLFETSFINPNSQLEHAIFLMQSAGYKPILAHPERYVYLYGKFDELKKIKEMGVHLQVNISSITGHYSKTAKDVAEKLIDEGLVSFLGSDCHNRKHIANIEKARELTHYRKALQLDLLNNKL